MKLLLVPDAPPPLVLIIIFEPEAVRVTGIVITPFTKLPVVVGLIVPAETLRLFALL